MKVGNGHDDATIDRINKELAVVKISKDPARCPIRTCNTNFVPHKDREHQLLLPRKDRETDIARKKERKKEKDSEG